MKSTEILRIIGLVAMASTLTSCVRDVDLWGLKVDFAEGFDVHAGMNGVDQVKDERGVSRVDYERNRSPKLKVIKGAKDEY